MSETINVPPGYYVVGYLTPQDPKQTEGSKLTIAWFEKHKLDGTWQIFETVHDGTATVASVRIVKQVTDYPINGRLLYRASATQAKDPATVWFADNRTNTAQELARQEAVATMAKTGNKAAQAAGKLADTTAKEVVENIQDIDRGPNWQAIGLGVAAAGVGLYALTRVFK